MKISIGNFAMLDARDSELVFFKKDGKGTDESECPLNKINYELLRMARKEYLDGLIKLREEIKEKYDNLFVAQEEKDIVTKEEIGDIDDKYPIYVKKYWSVFYH